MSQKEPDKNNRLTLTKLPACDMRLKSYESDKKISDYEVVPSFVSLHLQLSLPRDNSGLHLLSFERAVFLI